MDIQTFKTPTGEEMVILPRADYDALIAAAQPYDEDADDVAIYDQRMAERAARNSPTLPPDLSMLILRGYGRLKAIRKWRGLTQQDLAEKAGIAQGYLSSIEGGSRTGAHDTLVALAKVLDVPKEWIV